MQKQVQHDAPKKSKQELETLNLKPETILWLK